MNFQSIIEFIVFSSKDSDKISRSLKWLGSMVVVFLVWKGVDISVAQGLVDEGVKSGTDFWFGLGQFLTEAGALLTILAKIWNTTLGEKLGKKV